MIFKREIEKKNERYYFEIINIDIIIYYIEHFQQRIKRL